MGRQKCCPPMRMRMSKRKKRLERLRQNPKNVSFDQLRQVLEDFGFILRRSSGSHFSFSVEIKGETTLFVVPYNKPIKAKYVKDALELIDELLLEVNEVNDDNEDE
jgi:predicted RNA binding protein YcfA (HicA-like mRNA interferase family)